jgi:hypothetical protein
MYCAPCCGRLAGAKGYTASLHEPRVNYEECVLAALDLVLPFLYTATYFLGDWGESSLIGLASGRAISDAKEKPFHRNLV